MRWDLGIPFPPRSEAQGSRMRRTGVAMELSDPPRLRLGGLAETGDRGGSETGILEHAERGVEHVALERGVARPPERVPERERHEERTGRAYADRDLFEQLDRDGRDLPPLEFRRHQTDRLVAGRSDRNEESGVDPVVREDRCRLGSARADEAPGGGDRSHEREMTRGDLADPSGGDQIFEPIEGKREVRIFRDPSVIERAATVAIDQPPEIASSRDQPVGKVAAAHGGVERGLPRGNEPRRGDDGHPAPRQRPREGRPGDGVDPPPGIRPDEETVFPRELGEAGQLNPQWDASSGEKALRAAGG